MNIVKGLERRTISHGFFNELQFVNYHSYLLHNLATEKISLILIVRARCGSDYSLSLNGCVKKIDSILNIDVIMSGVEGKGV